VESNGRALDPSRTPGAGGVAPPPDAPIETTQPLQPETIAHQMAQARANERELKPFNPPKARPPIAPAASPTVAVPSPAPKADVPGVNALADVAADFFGTEPSAVPVLAPPRSPSVPPHIAFNEPIPENDALALGEVEQMADLEPLSDEDRARMPAASNSESPSRGILKDLVPDVQSRKAVTGGFGLSLEGQYNPLDGTELRELVLSMFDELVKSTENDLRFSMGLTYPRVQARVVIEIEGYAEDANNSIRIERVRVPKNAEKGATPKDVARSLADRVTFVVLAKRQEFTPDGESEMPPDEFREKLGLPVPRMTMVPGVGGDPNMNHQFVDVVAPGTDARALMRG
jgi:hypothetical protein